MIAIPAAFVEYVLNVPGHFLSTFTQRGQPNFRLPNGELVTCKIASTSCATTRREFDLTTGNELRRRKPVQHATSGPAREYTYDTRKLFVATEVNEVGHQVNSTHEYGTGQELLNEGPNERTCTTNCPMGTWHPTKEQHKVRVDGLGRIIERYETVSADGYIFQLHLAETNTYVDNTAPAAANSITNKVLVDEAGTTWREEKTEIDGLGRPIKTTVFAQGTAPMSGNAAPPGPSGAGGSRAGADAGATGSAAPDPRVGSLGESPPSGTRINTPPTKSDSGGARHRAPGEKGARMRASDGVATANAQAEDLAAAASRAARNKTYDDGTSAPSGRAGRINNTKKSEDNLQKVRLNRIKRRDDVTDDDID